MSNHGQAQKHPAYQELISNKEYLPFIIQAMRNGQYLCWWYHAIVVLVGDRPKIPEDARGRYDVLLKIYDEWLKTKGL